MSQSLSAPAALAAMTVVASPAPAQETTLNPIVVTPGRTAQTADEALAAVSVITRAEIERRQPQSVLELLRTEPGVDISRNGGLGSVSSVFLRGAQSDQVLVLVDGVRAASATAGTFAFDQLNPAQIERIEIVRGPRSTLYGSDAIGGVIQIFTRDVEGPSVSVEGGSHETYRAQAGYGGGEQFRYSVNGAYVDSEGFSSQNPGGFSFDPDDDGYEEASLTANVDAQLTDHAALRLRGWHSDGEVEFDQGVTDTRNTTANLSLDLDTLSAWRQRLSAGYAADDQTTDSDFPSDLDTQRLSLGWQNDIDLGAANLLTLGVNYYDEQGESTGSFPFDESVNNIGGYVNVRFNFGANDLQLGGRYDEHSNFGGNATGQIALGRELTETIRGFVSFGNAFKAPTLNELFFPGSGNPDLDPERSRTTELGLSYASAGDALRLDGNAFYTEIDDLIETVPDAASPIGFSSRNVAQASVKGLELSAAWRISARWRTYADATLQEARDETNGGDLVRRPDQKLVAGVTRVFEVGGSVTAEGLLSSERAAVGGERLPGYGIVNLSGRYPVLESLFVEARVENLLDKDYELAQGFNTPGVSGYVGMRYSPR